MTSRRLVSAVFVLSTLAVLGTSHHAPTRPTSHSGAMHAPGEPPLEAVEENLLIQKRRVEQVRHLVVAGRASIRDVLEAQERAARAELLLVRLGQPSDDAIETIESVIRLSVQVLQEADFRSDEFSDGDRAERTQRLAEWRVVHHELEQGTWSP